jgi:GNAT superfamily N-acetyltransferase
MSLRAARPDDVDLLARLHWLGWEEAYRGGLLTDALLDGTTLEMRRAQWRDWWPKLMDGLLIAEREEDREGEAVGFACVRPARDVAALGATSELQLLYVLAQAQGEGHGARLFDAARILAARLWPGPMGLWVVTANARARRFYERRGGRAGPERREWLRGEPIDEIAYLWSEPPAGV